MEDIFGQEVLKDLGFGGALGFLVGFTLKRVFKIAAFILGLYILSLIWLADKGVISVNWAAFGKFAGSFFSSFESFAKTAVRTVSFGGSFAIGFVAGMKV
ncbi:putative membrane protein (Fun14 family) [Hydrogenivirga caldilitoris]|uniref:Putative membrane protein (Fun14 family) n=1 Tax=Hydrogenivirga caldilitoris TaxID=246264 RepID=A0A497XTS6_9AQUI|nr:FUN14 domain-containing protein [Hydrogenivirga caldilitoris]RLJ71580.1 putative membrane protein (Fun14 family) [Hydrogenivirga caldilitoris]